jgi:hypothetical protein
VRIAIGLQFGFRSFRWIAIIPPMCMIIAFKFYINRTFVPAFNFFNPTEEEIARAKTYSERADNRTNKLESRFGHPALHAELFTPMLHKNMMPLLSQVYGGRINNDKAKLDEYGGQQMEAQVVPGGIKIAAIDQVSNLGLLQSVSLINTFFASAIWSTTLCYTKEIVASSTGINAPFHQLLHSAMFPRPIIQTSLRKHLLDTTITFPMALGIKILSSVDWIRCKSHCLVPLPWQCTNRASPPSNH